MNPNENPNNQPNFNPNHQPNFNPNHQPPPLPSLQQCLSLASECRDGHFIVNNPLDDEAIAARNQLMVDAPARSMPEINAAMSRLQDEFISYKTILVKNDFILNKLLQPNGNEPICITKEPHPLFVQATALSNRVDKYRNELENLNPSYPALLDTFVDIITAIVVLKRERATILKRESAVAETRNEDLAMETKVLYNARNQNVHDRAENRNLRLLSQANNILKGTKRKNEALMSRIGPNGASYGDDQYMRDKRYKSDVTTKALAAIAYAPPYRSVDGYGCQPLPVPPPGFYLEVPPPPYQAPLPQYQVQPQPYQAPDQMDMVPANRIPPREDNV